MSDTVLEMAQAERDAINRDRIRLMEKVAELEKEKKQLMSDLITAVTKGGVCVGCVHLMAVEDVTCDCECDECKDKCPCHSCDAGGNYKWRGVCEANSQ